MARSVLFYIKDEHRADRLHRNADALNRRTFKQCGKKCAVQDRDGLTARQLFTPKTEAETESQNQDLNMAQDTNKDISPVKKMGQTRM